MPGNILTTSAGLYDPAQVFSINLVPVVESGSALSGAANTICTFTTTTAHGFGAVLTAFQRIPSYNVATGQGPQLGVILASGTGATILNSTWLVSAVPSTTSFSVVLTPAQAVQAAGTLAGATVTPFMTLPPGMWDVALGLTDTLQWAVNTPALPPGPVGGANTTVAGVVGGSVLQFSALGNAAGAPIGGGTYISWLNGAATGAGDNIQTDGVTFFVQFGATAGVSRIFKRN